MAHPFFDASAYPWHRPEAVRFYQALTDAVPNVGRIDLIYRQCGNRLPALALTNPPDLIWKEALQNLTAQGALRKLCGVVLGMDNLKTIYKAAEEIVNAQEEPPPPPLSQSPLTPSKRRELLQRLDALQPEYDLRAEKLKRLRAALGKATDEAIKFQLEHQISDEETALTRLSAEIEQIEQSLN